MQRNWSAVADREPWRVDRGEGWEQPLKLVRADLSVPENQLRTKRGEGCESPEASADCADTDLYVTLPSVATVKQHMLESVMVEILFLSVLVRS